MAATHTIHTAHLLSGYDVPVLGLGVYQALGQKCVTAVNHALKLGYRHIDTAEFYENEKEVGQAVRDSGIPREQIFVTTKLWTDGHGKRKAKDHFERSLANLGLEYIDLYLIHAPSGGKVVETYDALLELQKQGLVRSIGVSNFGVQHLEGLRQAQRPLPAVNQIELHPFLQQKQIVEYCRHHGIVVQAYSPLGKGGWLDDPALKQVAQRSGHSVAQVLIRWSLQKGYVCLPKSSSPDRIAENFNVFDWSLDDEAMALLDGLDANRHCTWDPTSGPWTG